MPGDALSQKYGNLQAFCKLQKPLAKYLTALAWRRSRVRVSSGPLLFCGDLQVKLGRQEIGPALPAAVVQQRVARVLASRRTRAGHPVAYTTSLAPPLRAQRLSGGARECVIRPQPFWSWRYVQVLRYWSGPVSLQPYVLRVPQSLERHRGIALQLRWHRLAVLQLR